MNSGNLRLEPECLRPIEAAGGCLVAVSGGADSVALLQSLYAWAGNSPVHPRLAVLHVHHQLRGEEADEDARFVETMARELGMEFRLAQTPPPDHRPRGATLEEYLRAERHALFEKTLEELNLTVLALGHTADDLAETFLMHLMRGAGLRGLSFGPVEEHGPARWVRPLWNTSRADIVDWLSHLGIAHREDSTNLSTEFTRNRVRLVLLPLLEREFSSSVRQTLLRTASTLSGAEDFIRTQAAKALEHLTAESGDQLVLPAPRLRELHPFLQSEVISEWLRHETEGRLRASTEQIRAVVRLAEAGRGRTDLPEGTSVVAAAGRLTLVESAAGASRGTEADRQQALRHLADNPSLPVAELPPDGIHGESGSQTGTLTFRFRLLDGRETTYCLAASPAGQGKCDPSALILRNRRPGDRVPGLGKLKEVLINDKVPAYLRNYLIVAATPEGEVVHVAGLKRVNGRLPAIIAPICSD